MKIAIEGMDGVGKSTIARMIADKYGFEYLEKPLAELFVTEDADGITNLMNIAPNIYAAEDDIIKAWFFGLGNLQSILNHKNDDVIIDRHFASNYFWNGSEKTKPIFELLLNYVSIPDITILLYASPETRIRRISLRNKNDSDLTDPEKHVLGYDKMIAFLEEFKIPYVVVDTENKDINGVFEEVSKIVSGLIEKEKQYIKKDS